METTDENKSNENGDEASSGKIAQESESSKESSTPRPKNCVDKTEGTCQETEETCQETEGTCQETEGTCQETESYIYDDRVFTDDEEPSPAAQKPNSSKKKSLKNDTPKLYSTSNDNGGDLKNSLNLTPKSSTEELNEGSQINVNPNVADPLPVQSALQQCKLSRDDSKKLHSSQIPKTSSKPNVPVHQAEYKYDPLLNAQTPNLDYSDDDMPSSNPTNPYPQLSSFDMDDDDDNEPKTFPIYAKITNDLKFKRDNFSQNTIVPFFVEDDGNTGIDLDDDGHWKWRDSSFIRLPQSPLNLNIGRHEHGKKNWAIIEKQLRRLQKACEQNNVQHDMGTILNSVVRSYKPDAEQISNFGILGRPELQNVLKETLPIIIELALQLPQLLSEPLPILKSGESKTIYLTRKLCGSLLANAFFCTYPEPSRQFRMPDYNFIRLFNDTNTDRCEVKKEKIKCILNYFNILCQQPEDFKNQIVSFERRSVSYRADWDNSDKPMCEVNIEPNQKIEEAEGMLQVDFANKYIGGGVLNDGSVQEEIRFSISPELIIGRIFMEAMTDDEAIIITGSQIYSEYTGYSTSFKFAGKYSGDVNAETDNLGRTFAQLAAIDALNFKRHDIDKQFGKYFIDRELHKCYVAFIHGKKIITPVATGNWGCGAFNGNPELKFMIQWMAASHQERPLLQFHKVKDQQQEKSIQDITKFMQTNKVQVGQLYKTVTHFHRDMHKYRNSSLFDYVKEKFGGASGGGYKGIGIGNFRIRF